MKYLLILLLFLSTTISAQNDFNFEFVTSSHAELMSLDSMSNPMSLHLPCLVSKEYNDLLIVSPQDFTNVRYKGEVTYLGCESGLEWMLYQDASNNVLKINPMKQLVEIHKDGKVIARYGISMFK